MQENCFPLLINNCQVTVTCCVGSIRINKGSFLRFYKNIQWVLPKVTSSNSKETVSNAFVDAS